MLRDYRDWLEAEIDLIIKASNHAYSSGQVTMARRALERFDAELGKQVYLPIERHKAFVVLNALEMLAQRETTLDPVLGSLREQIKIAIQDDAPPMNA